MLKTLLSLLTVFSLLLCSCGKKQLLSPVFDNNVQAEKDKSAKSSEVEEVKDESKSAKSFEAEEVKDESKDESKDLPKEKKDQEDYFPFVLFYSICVVSLAGVIFLPYYIVHFGIDCSSLALVCCGSVLTHLSALSLVYYDEEPLFGLSSTSWTLGLLAGITLLGAGIKLSLS